MKHFITLLITLFLTTSCMGDNGYHRKISGSDNSKEQLAKELVGIYLYSPGNQDMIDLISEQFLEEQKNTLGECINKQGYLRLEKGFRKTMNDLVYSESSFKYLASLYENHYSKSELVGLIDFLNSPLGKKYMGFESTVVVKFSDFLQKYFEINLESKLKNILNDVFVNYSNKSYCDKIFNVN